MINAMALKSIRPTLDKPRSVITVVADYYRSNRASIKDMKDETDALREAALARQEEIVEKLSIHINNNRSSMKNWEYVQAMAELFKMQQLLMENRNWNASRANPDIKMTQNNIHIYQNTFVNQEKSPAMLKVMEALD